MLGPPRNGRPVISLRAPKKQSLSARSIDASAQRVNGLQETGNATLKTSDPGWDRWRASGPRGEHRSNRRMIRGLRVVERIQQ
eukprot:2332274-Pyramimonas_sp.AAC.1